MHESILKLEPADVDESNQPCSDVCGSGSSNLSESAGEMHCDEKVERRLYRRSVAYFLFGLGYNKNAIITDEP